MIAKILTGTNAKGLLQYLTAKKNEIITSNKIFPNLSLKEIANEIEMIQGLNQRCKKNTMHIILSFPCGENINTLKMKSITEDFLEAFKTKECMSISFQHFDKNHPHVHCLINKIKDDGSVLSDSYSYIKAKNICRKIEQIYNLQRISNYKQENSNSAIKKLQFSIDQAIQSSESLDELIKLLLLKKYKTLKGRGISFINIKNGTKIKGSAIGRDYSLSNIKKRIESNLKTKEELKDIKKIIKIKPKTIKR